MQCENIDARGEQPELPHQKATVMRRRVRRGVALAMLGYIKKPIDLVVSGINPNANIGHESPIAHGDFFALNIRAHALTSMRGEIFSIMKRNALVACAFNYRLSQRVFAIFF